MSSVERFIAYAVAFEKCVESDDWSILDPFFTEDVVYDASGGPPFGGRWEGREAVYANFKRVLDEFDRRFASRSGEILEGPSERDGAIWMRWVGVYEVEGVPPLRIEGEETAYFDGDRITRIEDRIPDDQGERAMAFLAEHAGKLKP